ncbi:SWIM zinc finger domain protein, partial [Opisthorchis viverrini]
MYVRVTSPTKDSTIRVQFNFKRSPASCERSELTELKPSGTEQSIKQALTRSFVLVCQPAPNAFVLVSRTTQTCRNNAQHAGDECVDPTPLGSVRRRPRFHVVIGPQLCNCQDYPPADDSSPRRPAESVPRVVPPVNQPCVHVLFVMLRILKISADDPCLLNVPLPTSKAESLIHQYQNSKLTRRCELPRGHKCSLISVSDVDSKSATTGAMKETQTLLPLAMPKAIYPHRSGINSPRTPQLLALLNEKVQNSPECQELSTLTKDIKAVSRLDNESADATIDSGSTNPTSTTLSRTSSSDSVEGSRLQAASAYNLEESGDGSAQRRPQTAPQSDPPLKIMRGRAVSMRQEDRRLSPIKSGDISAHSCLRFRSEIKQHPYETLRQTQQVQSNSSSGISPQQTPIFRHVVHSPFKPVIRPSPSTWTENSPRVPKGQECVKSSTEEDSTQLPTDSGMQAEPCALCLETLEGDRSQDSNLVRCRSADAPQRCLATFHLTCCQIWLEEITLEGDSPHCPACLSRWDATPFTIENPQDCGINSAHSTEPSPSSHCCLCCTQSQDSVRKPVEEENTVTAKHPASDGAATISPTSELTSQCSSTTTLNSKGPTTKEAAVHPAQSSPPVTPNCPPYLDYKNCVAAFSLEVADAIAAQNSVARRQWALQRAAQLTVRRILVARQQHQQSKLKVSEASRDHEDQLGSERRAHVHSTTPPSVPTEPDCLRVMFRLIQHLFDDPADAIFIDALRAFRELLGYLVCFNVETQTALQRAIAPILRRLLRFVGGASVLWTLRSPTSGLPTPILMHQTSTTSVEGWNVNTPPMPDGRPAEKVDVLFRLDSKETDRSVMGAGVLPPPAANLRDRANLALATLVELAKGQNGALAIGRDVEC